MRYDDASNAGSMAADSAPTARPDVDSLPSNDFGPASGNVITGAGTASGATGADSAGDGPARVVEVNGPGGPTAAAGDSFQAAGQYGVLTMDAQGNFNYVRNAGTPDGVQDVFGYTIADRDGSTASTTLTMNVGEAITLQAQNVVNLPPGVEMSDIRVSGRDLIINMPDGTQMVIPGGAVFVPQLVIGDVELPQSTLARLLIDNEPQPGAGTQFSSGGPPPPPVPPLDPGVPLGDLVPPTDMSFPPFIVPEVGQFEDEEPGIIIDPDDNEPAVNAVSSVDESGLPARPGEPEGTLEPQNIETRGGQILIDSGDGIDSLVITVNGVSTPITSASVGTVIAGLHGNLTITSVNLDTGVVGYSYTVTDNTIDGSNDFEDFTVVVTDNDGDTATGTLHIDILDDESIAADDTDAVPEGANSTDGNVLTAVGTTNSGEDTPGADGFSGETNDSIDGLTGIHPGTSGAFTAVPQNGTGVTVSGTFGDLTIHVDGSYTYVLHEGTQGGGTDVFTYQITDGDGDNDTATLTITVPIQNEPPTAVGDEIAVSEEGLPDANEDDTGNPDTTNLAVVVGNIGASDPNGDPLSITLGVPNPNPNFTSQGGIVLWSVSPDGHTLTGYVDGGEGPDRLVITVEISDNAPGNYTVTLHDQIDHPDATTEDAVDFSIPVTVDDGTAPPINTTIEVSIEDDSPEPANNEGSVTGIVDEDDLPTGNDDVQAGDDDPGNDDGDNDGTTTGGAAGSLTGLYEVGADEPLTIGLSSDTSGLPTLHSGGVLITYSVLGNVLTGSAGGTPVFTLTVNADGSWVFDLQGQLDHEAGNDENNLFIDFSSVIEAEDFDHDPAPPLPSGSFVVNVDDDIPVPANNEGSVTGIVDEDDLPTGNDDVQAGDDDPGNADGDNDGTTTGGAAGSLTGLYDVGADEPLSIGLSGNTSGLPVLHSGGVLVTYSVLGNVLTGSAGGTPVFTLTVNPDGSWVFDLQGQLDHEAGGDENNLFIDFSSVITAEDFDHDPAPPLPNGSFVINVDDDIPVPANNEGSVTGIVDEDNLPNGIGDNATGDDDPGNADGDNDGTTTGAGAGSLTGLYDAGADVPLTIGLSSNTSGLQALTSGGVPVTYSVLGNVLTGSAGGTPVFTLTVNPDGSWTFDLQGPLDHAAGMNENNLFIDFSSVITAVDFDQDPAPPLPNGSFVINVDDDLPVAVDDTDQVLEGASTGGNVLTGVGGDLNPAGADLPGADGLAANAVVGVVHSSNDAVDTNNPLTVGVGIAGTYGTLTLNANGTYTYIADPGTNPPPGAQDIFTYTIIDKDGDMDSATLTINVIDDLTPVAGEVNAKVDDDGLSGSNPLTGTGDIDANAGEVGAGTASEAVWTGTLQGTPGDPPTTFLFQESLESVTTDTLGTEDLRYVVSADGLTLQAFVDSGARDGTLLFSIVINDASTGAYTLTLHDNVLHAPGGNDETSDTLTIPYQMVDDDGDLSVSPGEIHIEFNDDMPANNAGTVSITVHEDALNNANAVGNSTGEGAKTVSGSISVAQLQGLVSPGADSPVTIGLNAAIDGVNTGLTQNGVNIVWDYIDATHVRGLVNNDPTKVAFTLTFDGPNSEYDFVLLDNIDNTPTAAGDADTDSLSLANVFTATDADGDTIVIDAGASVNIENDVPVNNVTSLTAPTVHEDALNNANAVGNPEGVGQTVNASISVAAIISLVNPGADSPVTIGLNSAIDGTNTGLTQNGVNIVWDYIDATHVRGLVNNDPTKVAFTLTFDGPNSEYDFVLLDNIDHDSDNNLNTGEGDSFVESLSLDNVFTATDTDGDKVNISGGISINIENDVPQDIEPEAVNVEQGGTVTGDLDLAGPDGDLNGVADNYGADGPGTVRFPSSLEGTDSGLESQGQNIIYHLVDGQTLQGRVGATVIFTITLDPTSSEYTVDLDGIIDSLTQINFNDGTYDFVGGNDTWAGFVPLDQIDGKAGDAPINDDSKDLLLTPIGSGTAVNGNATSAGVTGPIAGQNIGEGEGMRLDFIEDLTGIGTPGDYNDAGEQTHDFDAHYLINGASVRFGQGTSTLTTTSFRAIKVTPEVIDDNGDDGTPDLVDGTGALVSVNRVVINYDGEFQVVDFDAGNLTQTVTVGNPGGLADRSYTVTFIQEGGEWYATVQGIHDVLMSVAIFADEQYNALELLHEGPDSADADYAITGFGAATQSTDPVGFEVPVEIVDADGDTADGTLDVTVYPVGGVPAPLTLLSANDNQEQKLASNNTMIMSAALAAAGLATEPLAASPREHGDRRDSNEDRGGKTNDSSRTVDTSSDEDQSSVSQLVGTEAKEADNAADDSSPSQDDAAAADKGVSNENAPAPAVSELSQGTDAPTQSEAQASAPAMADSVGMPSAEQLIAASKDGVDGKLESVDGKDAGHDEQVAKVLADALQGGEHGKDLDALIDAVSGKGQDGDKALEALASHGGNDVSNGDMAGFGGLSASHGMDMMTQMTMHQDAAPAQA